MRCLSPRTVGFKADGKTICWSSKQSSKEFASFQLPCGKCLECRLDYARQWAIRCVHEAQMHEKNCFITLTYDDAHLASPKLIYSDFQNFMKRLRRTQNDPIGVFVTGEYGDKTKRPHWHAILFNYDFSDRKALRTNERGDRIYTSCTLDKIWQKGMAEIGSVTFESAGYCARYAAKKLCHGRDSDHDYQPISKKSSKHAIGKKWLEKFWPDVFKTGLLVLADGSTSSIPRYYERWLKENHPSEWLTYVTSLKQEKIKKAEKRSAHIQNLYLNQLYSRSPYKPNPFTPCQVRSRIIQAKFKMLQAHLKL